MKSPTKLHGTISPVDGDRDSIFIVCPSYEPRTTAALHRLDRSYVCERAIICRAVEYIGKGDSERNCQDVLERLRLHSKTKPESVDFSLDKPITFLQDFRQKLDGLDKRLAVTIDITTFPRQEMMLLLKLFDQSPQRGHLRLLFGEPVRYATECREKEFQWLTRGVTAVHSIPGFCGIQYPQLGKLLVIILGHEGERTFITLRRHQPDKVILLAQGGRQYHSGLARISKSENQNLIDQFGTESIWHHKLPAHGIAETREQLEEIFRLYRSKYNVFLASNGTKLQSVGTYLAVRDYLEVQVTYASPALYNWERYSEGCGALWETSLPPSELVKPDSF